VSTLSLSFFVPGCYFLPEGVIVGFRNFAGFLSHKNNNILGIKNVEKVIRIDLNGEKIDQTLEPKNFRQCR
jgi:hypothetical protein